MTPDDIRSQRFGTRLLGGLNAEEVTAFLEDVADAFDTVQKHNAALETRVHSLAKEGEARHDAPARLEDDAASMTRALKEEEAALASRLEALRSAALREVEALLHNAQLQA